MNILLFIAGLEKRLRDPEIDDGYVILPTKLNDPCTPKKNKLHVRYLFLKMFLFPVYSPGTRTVRSKQEGDGSSQKQRPGKQFVD